MGKRSQILLPALLIFALTIGFGVHPASAIASPTCTQEEVSAKLQAIKRGYPSGSTQSVAKILQLFRLCRMSEKIEDDMIMSLIGSAKGHLREELLYAVRAKHLMAALPILESQLELTADMVARHEIISAIRSLRAVCELPQSNRSLFPASRQDSYAVNSKPISQITTANDVGAANWNYFAEKFFNEPGARKPTMSTPIPLRIVR